MARDVRPCRAPHHHEGAGVAPRERKSVLRGPARGTAQTLICPDRLNTGTLIRLFIKQFGQIDMRCLVVADLHYSLPQFDWLLSAAPNFDLVIFAGDALDVGSSVDFRAQIVVVKKYLELLSGLTRVILCSGNHD